MVNEFSDRVFDPCPDVGNTTSICFKTGEQVLAFRTFEESTVGGEIAKLIGLVVGFRFVAYLALRFCNRQKLRLELEPSKLLAPASLYSNESDI